MQVYSVVLALEAVAGSKLFVTGDEAGEIKVIYFVVCIFRLVNIKLANKFLIIFKIQVYISVFSLSSKNGCFGKSRLKST